MEKTIAPRNIVSVSETVGPQKGLTHREVLSDSEGRLTPSFFVYEKNKVRHVQIPEDENIFKIGRSESADITINDNTLSDIQIAIVKLGNYCYFMDCGTKDRSYFNGVLKRQMVVPAESRMVMKVGKTSIVYVGLDCRNLDETDSIILKRSLIHTHSTANTESEAEILLKSNFGEWYSDSAPILVGSHNSCDYKISGPMVKPFHFIVYFSPQGAFIEDLTGGSPGIKVDGLSCRGCKPIKGDLIVAIEKLEIFLYVYGEISQRSQSLFAGYKPNQDLALTPLSFPDAQAIPLPKTNERLTIGRSSECNLVIPDPSVSRIHAHVIIRDKCLFLVDNNSHNKTYVNLKPIIKSSVLPGDIMEFGDTAYMLHYH